MTAKKTPATRAEASAILSGIDSNLGDEVPEEFGRVVKSPPPPREKPGDYSGMPGEKRVWIQLEDNEEISPVGQFIGINGRGFMLQPGVPAFVPESIINALDTAVKSIPIKDQSDRIVRWTDRLRFPYRILTNYKPKAA